MLRGGPAVELRRALGGRAKARAPLGQQGYTEHHKYCIKAHRRYNTLKPGEPVFDPSSLCGEKGTNTQSTTEKSPNYQ